MILHESLPAAPVSRPMAERYDAADVQSWCLRVGLAFVFLYAAVSAAINPAGMVGYFPSFLPEGFILHIALPLFGVYELVLSVALLFGYRTRAAALLAAATLFGIIVCNPEAFNVLFRNVAIICGAVALAASPRERAAA